MKELKKGIYRRYDDEYIDVLDFFEGFNDKEMVLYQRLKNDQSGKQDENKYAMPKYEFFIEVLFREKKQPKYKFWCK